MQTPAPDGLATAASMPQGVMQPPEQSRLPDWNSAHLRLAIEAAGVALWSWNVDTNRFRMDERAFELWGVPLSDYVSFEYLSSHIHPATAIGSRRHSPRLAPSLALMKSISAS